MPKILHDVFFYLRVEKISHGFLTLAVVSVHSDQTPRKADIPGAVGSPLVNEAWIASERGRREQEDLSKEAALSYARACANSPAEQNRALFQFVYDYQ